MLQEVVITPYYFYDVIPCPGIDDLANVLGTFATGEYEGAPPIESNQGAQSTEAAARLIDGMIVEARQTICNCISRGKHPHWSSNFRSWGAGTRLKGTAVSISRISEELYGLELCRAGADIEDDDRMMDDLARHFTRLRRFSECGIKLNYEFEDDERFVLDFAPLLRAFRKVFDKIDYNAKALMSSLVAYDDPKVWMPEVGIANVGDITATLKMFELSIGQRFEDEDGEDLWVLSGTRLIGYPDMFGGPELRVAIQYYTPPLAPLSKPPAGVSHEFTLDPKKIAAVTALMQPLERALKAAFPLHLRN